MTTYPRTLSAIAAAALVVATRSPRSQVNPRLDSGRDPLSDEAGRWAVSSPGRS